MRFLFLAVILFGLTACMGGTLGKKHEERLIGENFIFKGQSFKIGKLSDNLEMPCPVLPFCNIPSQVLVAGFIDYPIRRDGQRLRNERPDLFKLPFLELNFLAEATAAFAAQANDCETDNSRGQYVDNDRGDFQGNILYVYLLVPIKC
ncbi:hypothetical protein N8912_00750 [Rhodobacteraceae bacterium]|nr:hypothetical protein [Paracoccaceae bacterium]